MEDVEVLVTDLIPYLNAKLFVGNSYEKHSYFYHGYVSEVVGVVQDLIKAPLLVDPHLFHPLVTSHPLNMVDVAIIFRGGHTFGRLAHVNHIFTLDVVAVETGMCTCEIFLYLSYCCLAGSTAKMNASEIA